MAVVTSPSLDFFAGGLSSVMAITLVHPVDVVKCRRQFVGEQCLTKPFAGGKGQPVVNVYSGMISSLRKIYSVEGLKGLYRGLPAAYGLQLSVSSTRFGVYAVGKNNLDNFLGQINMQLSPTASNFFLGAVSGLFGSALGNAFFTLKVRHQVFSSSSELSVGTQNAPKPLWECFRDIYREEGFRGYFRGYSVFAPRVVAFGGVQFGCYDTFKPAIQKRFNLTDGPTLHFSSAFFASILATMALQPFDFVTVRVQNQKVDPVTRKGLLYSGPIDCLIKSVRIEGLSCLLNGLGANMCRMGPYSVLILVFFEQNKRLLSNII